MIRKTVIAILAFCVFATTAAFFASIKYRFGYLGDWVSVGVERGVFGIGFVTPPFVSGWIWEEHHTFHPPLFGLPSIYSSVSLLSIVIPLWLLFILFAVYPVLAFIRGPLNRYRRRRKGLCIKCGYNLTGNTSGICPECGTAT